jgi:putative restriction endonuclease
VPDRSTSPTTARFARQRELQVPLVYFVGTRPGWYRPSYPFFVIADDPAAKQVLVAPGTMTGPVDELEPILPEDPIDRRYAVREVRVRIHQARFRGRVVPAYRGQCAICRLKEVRLLDAAHIVSDIAEQGDPIVSNGLALCSIHHRAFDHDLVAVSPDYEVRVSERLLHDEDGPMLELLKTFDRNSIYVPRRTEWKPDRERLAARYERFLAASAR